MALDASVPSTKLIVDSSILCARKDGMPNKSYFIAGYSLTVRAYSYTVSIALRAPIARLCFDEPLFRNIRIL